MTNFNKYESSPAQLEDGQAINYQQVDSVGNLKGTLATDLDRFDAITTHPAKASMEVELAAGANLVVSATPALLVGIIIGADVASSVIEVSDHASDGDGNVKIDLNGSTLMTSTGGYVPVNAYFATGICVDQTNQTKVTYIYIPD